MTHPLTLAGATAVAVLGALLLGGCLNLGAGTVEPTRFYLLEPLGRDGAAGSEKVSLAVGPVSLPAYLDRPHLVTRVGRSELRFAEFARWGEPLRDLFPRVLAEDLAGLLGTEAVCVFPCGGSERVDYQVAVEVLRFDAEASFAVLEARWSVRPTGSGHPPAAERTSLSEPLTDPSPAGIAAGQSRALGALARRISRAVQTLEGTNGSSLP